MRDNRIYEVRTHKYKATTDSHHRFNVAPNWLDRNFHADQPNEKWVGDITYIRTTEGRLYLAVMIDLHSRRVVGWATSNRLKLDLALQPPISWCCDDRLNLPSIVPTSIKSGCVKQASKCP